MPQSFAEPETTSAIFVFTPAESKRFIAKAVAAMPVVRRAMGHGRIIIANGSTNGYVAEELLGVSLPKERRVAGHIADGNLGILRDEFRLSPFVLINGQAVDVPWPQVAPDFTGNDIFIKGANAVDPGGNAGIILAGSTSGTIGIALGTVVARGAHLIVPVGLEKLVSSVVEAARRMGQRRIAYPEGEGPGLMPLVTATVVTEITAFDFLFGLQATQVAAGGVGGSEGAVVLVAEGNPDQVQAALTLTAGIKGEPPFPAMTAYRQSYGKDFPMGVD